MASDLRNALTRLRTTAQSFERALASMLADIDAAVSAIDGRAAVLDLHAPSDPSAVRELYHVACVNTPWDPDALYAIWHHETGHGVSKAWRLAHNPGGLKYHPEFEYLGHTFGLWQEKPPDSVKYARFPSDEEGVRAHVRFLLNKRYAPARNLPPLAQARKIGELGYVEAGMLAGWLDSVSSILGKIQKGKLA